MQRLRARLRTRGFEAEPRYRCLLHTSKAESIHVEVRVAFIRASFGALAGSLRCPSWLSWPKLATTWAGEGLCRGSHLWCLRAVRLALVHLPAAMIPTGAVQSALLLRCIVEPSPRPAPPRPAPPYLVSPRADPIRSDPQSSPVLPCPVLSSPLPRLPLCLPPRRPISSPPLCSPSSPSPLRLLSVTSPSPLRPAPLLLSFFPPPRRAQYCPARPSGAVRLTLVGRPFSMALTSNTLTYSSNTACFGATR